MFFVADYINATNEIEEFIVDNNLANEFKLIANTDKQGK